MVLGRQNKLLAYPLLLAAFLFVIVPSIACAEEAPPSNGIRYYDDPCKVKGACGIGGVRGSGRVGNVLSNMRGKRAGRGYRRHHSGRRGSRRH